MALTIGDLLDGKEKPVSVRRGEKLDGALELMLRHDYSQLPVVNEQGKLLGILTSDSIVKAIASFDIPPERLMVDDAMTKTRAFDTEADAADLLGALRDQYAAVVVDADDVVLGVVTNFDAAGYFRRRAEDLMLVEDIESSLKERIQLAFQDAAGTLDASRLARFVAQSSDANGQTRTAVSKAIRRYCAAVGGQRVDDTLLERVLEQVAPSKPATFESLSLGGYIDLLFNDTVWASQGSAFGVEREPLRGLLGKVRKVRNALAHFRKEVTAVERRDLKFCAEWLERRAPRRATEPPSPTPERGVDEPCATDSVVVTDAVQPGESRLAKLAVWLQSVEPGRDLASLSFAQVEGVLGSPLPVSAKEHRHWWANDSGHAQAHQWLDTGWRVGSISITDGVVTFRRMKDQQAAYIAFFSEVREALVKAGVTVSDASPWGGPGHNLVRVPQSGDFIAWIFCSFGRQSRLRVELYIDTGDGSLNKQYFDYMLAQRTEIESRFGERLSWERLDASRASKVVSYHDGAITAPPQERHRLRDWAADAIRRLNEAVRDSVVRLGANGGR